ncbi:FAD-dependent monooxygenase [Caldimonas thermodepolymerans]|uniref:FAD-dependent monooxygenase n=1 Tax=Caldimonas thermodepolymerans TaxID=215580 RepID=UPI00223689E6|nr:FAD-dependent monooxygenase [Caldimonas thermodepolymerans]UZG45213.1 FAD-dependent monooxygenase [Caldimonas thermodepolymerans]
MRTLKAIVVGGGIGGLAAAIALLQRGIDVEVYEQAGELREFGAGIQISPNGNRALHALGVFEALRALSCDADGKEIRLWNTGRMWPLFNLGDQAIRKYGFPYMTVFRPDLLRVLGEQVRRLKPDAIHLNARCVGFAQTGDGVSVQLADGRWVHGDLLLGADGVHSVMRGLLHGPDEIQFTGMVAWRALIPMEALPSHLVRNVALNWIGPGGHLVHYPVQGGRLMNFVGTLEGDRWGGPPWQEPSTREACAQAFAGWHEDIHTMIQAAPSVTRWAMCLRPFLERWTVGRATLSGDACHPTLPLLGQGAVSSIEDGIVLARCLEKYDDVPTALQRYEAVRRPHTYAMVRGSSENLYRFHNPVLATPETAEPFISREWQTQAISDRYDWLFTYDAEAVEI